MSLLYCIKLLAHCHVRWRNVVIFNFLLYSVRVLHSVEKGHSYCRVESLDFTQKGSHVSAAMQIPPWMIAIGACLVFFASLSAWAVFRYVPRPQRFYPLLFLFVMIVVGGQHFIQMQLNVQGQPADRSYRFHSNEWSQYYLLLQAATVILVVVMAFSNFRAITPRHPAVGLTLQLTACGYNTALILSEIATHAPTRTQQSDIMEVGAYTFFMTSIVMVMTLLTCLSMWCQKRSTTAVIEEPKPSHRRPRRKSAKSKPVKEV